MKASQYYATAQTAASTALGYSVTYLSTGDKYTDVATHVQLTNLNLNRVKKYWARACFAHAQLLKDYSCLMFIDCVYYCSCICYLPCSIEMCTNLLTQHVAIILLVASIVGTGSCSCIKNYHELEKSLFNSSINIDSLIKTFFPPNLPNPPIITVLYYFNTPNLTEHPVNILEMEGLETVENEVLPYDYQFRWSENPIYLFIDPDILEVLSLYSIHIHPYTARLLVDPICKNYSINGVPLPKFYLNQMTSLVSHLLNIQSL